jgi:cytochrome c556
MIRFSLIPTVFAVLLPLSPLLAQDAPQEARQELMKGVGEAAKPVGGMLKGELEFDAAVVMESLTTWSLASGKLGDLFPEGSESGYDTEARSTIWSDRDGFNTVLKDLTQAIQAGLEAKPQTLDELKPVAGPIFKQCKACHEGYRDKKED